jgi:hypothetical protein
MPPRVPKENASFLKADTREELVPAVSPDDLVALDGVDPPRRQIVRIDGGPDPAIAQCCQLTVNHRQDLDRPAMVSMLERDEVAWPVETASIRISLGRDVMRASSRLTRTSSRCVA